MGNKCKATITIICLLGFGLVLLGGTVGFASEKTEIVFGFSCPAVAKVFVGMCLATNL